METNPASPTLNSAPGASADPVVNANSGVATGVAPVTPATDWTSDFDPDSKGYVQNKGWDGAKGLLESYRNLEKLKGVPAERLLTMPEKADTLDGFKTVGEKFGLPKEAKDYTVDMPANSDPAFVEWAKSAFHKSGLTKSQAEALSKEWNGYATQSQTSFAEAQAAKTVEQDAALKKEWGAAYDQNVNLAKKAAREFGLDQTLETQLVDSIGFDKFAKLMHSVGSKLGEGSFVTSDSRGGSFGALTPDAARQRINDRMKDPAFANRLVARDADATQEWDNLHKFLVAGQ